MSGIILELQKEAMDKDVRISDLLRKAMLVAKKLKITEIETWLMSELNGYEDENVPTYRHVRGEIKAFNNYQGRWIPIMFPENLEKLHSSLVNQPCKQAVSEIEALLDDDSQNQMGMPYSAATQAKLMDAAEMPFPPVLLISKSAMFGILDVVKTKTLEWALKLEEEGVVGKGLSFSLDEKEAAANVTINVENMTGSQIQAGTSHSAQSMESNVDIQQIQNFTEQLQESLPLLSLDDETTLEVESEIATLEAQAKSPKPKVGIIKSSLASVKRILEAAGGNVTAQGLMRLIETMSVF